MSDLKSPWAPDSVAGAVVTRAYAEQEQVIEEYRAHHKACAEVSSCPCLSLEVVEAAEAQCRTGAAERASRADAAGEDRGAER